VSDHDPMSAEERKAQEALKALSRPSADSNVRSRLRRAFVEGTIRPGVLDLGAPSQPMRPSTARRPWFLDRRAQVGLAIAAAVTVVTVMALNRPPKWEVSDASGEGIALVDGRGIPMNHRAELSAALRPGAPVRLPGGTELEIACAGNLLVQFTAGTDATVPEAPGRWFGRSVRGTIREGELRITTGPAFRGARLAIRSPEAQVEVRGTTLAVIREPHGTCICVLEGRVRVGPHGGDMIEIESGNLRFFFNDGRPPGSDAMRPIERVELERLKESRSRLLDR